jgi:hypothetical protein
MQQRRLVKVLSIGCLTGLAGLAAVPGILGIPHTVSAQDARPKPVPPYNPYPPGILPPGLDSEIARVQREVQTIYNRYFAEWQALNPTPTYTGNPPILVPNGYEAQRILGGLLNFDANISPFQRPFGNFRAQALDGRG